MEAIAKRAEPVGYVPAMLALAALLIAVGGSAPAVAVAVAAVLAAGAVWVASDPRV